MGGSVKHCADFTSLRAIWQLTARFGLPMAAPGVNIYPQEPVIRWMPVYPQIPVAERVRHKVSRDMENCPPPGDTRNCPLNRDSEQTGRDGGGQLRLSGQVWSGERMSKRSSAVSGRPARSSKFAWLALSYSALLFVHAFAAVMIVSGPGHAASCSPGPTPVAAIHIAGTERDAQLMHLAAVPALDIARSDPSATVAIAASELRAHIGGYSSLAIPIKAGSPAPCDGAIMLNLAPATLGKSQGFQLRAADGNLIVTAATPVGLLYGAYEVLYTMGFRWFAAGELWLSQPLAAIALPQPASPLAYEPRFQRRGAVTFDAKVPDSHLLWLARNRQNLIGASGVDPNVARALGIELDDGGHHIISTIVHSSRQVDGRSLVEAYPDWYGLTAQEAASRPDPVPYKSETYRNPCLAHQGMIDFLARELADRLIEGDLKDIAVLHLWPSDQTALNLPASCLAQMPDKQPIEHLLYFYSGVMDILQMEIARRNPERKVTIAGISYYDTWELPPKETFKQLKPRPNVDFMQVLYLNERSFAAPISAASLGTNQRIEAKIAAWSATLAPLGILIGVCEYYGYSAHYSIPAVFQRVVADDAATYERHSVSHMNYMHPLWPDAGPQRLLEALRSRLYWRGTETAPVVVNDYYQRMFGGGDVVAAFEDVDLALTNMSEILGGTSSLLNMLGQHKMWDKPAFPEARVPEAVDAFRKGGRHRLPLIRTTHFSPLESEFIGLAESLGLLRSAELRLKAALADASGDLHARLAQDAPWVTHARAIYEAVDLIADLVARPRDHGSSRAVAQARMAALLEEVKSAARFGHTVSGYDQRELFEGRMGYARSRLEALADFGRSGQRFR